MIVAGLHEDIEDGAILIDGAPQVVDGAIDREEHLVKMPRITRTRSVAAQCWMSTRTAGVLPQQ